MTGTADAVVEWGRCTEERFLQIMRKIVWAKPGMYDAFNDVITRLDWRIKRLGRSSKRSKKAV